MATIKTAVDIDVNVQGTQTVQQASQGFDSLKTQFRAAKKEAELLTAQYGLMDERTQEAIRRTGEFKDQMEELSRRIESQKSGLDTHLQAIRGVAGGFEAAAGAAALMGVESEDLQKTLLRVQGAMAFAQGIDQFMDFLPAIKSTAVALKNQLIPALRTTQGLIKGLGIGAIIGLVIMFKDKLLELVAPLKGIIQSFTDWIGLTSEMERTMESAYLAAEKQADAIQRQIDLRTAQGASEQELYKLQKQLAEQQLVMAQNMAAEEEEQIKEKEKAILDANNRIAVVEAEHQTHLREIREEARLKELEERQAAEEAFNELMAQVNEDAEKQIRNQASRDAFERNKQIAEQEKEALRIVQEATEKGLLTQEQASDETDKIVDLANKRRLESDKQYLTDKRNMLMAQRELEIKTAQDIAEGLLAINELFAGKEAKSQEAAFKRAKALNISVATMDTFVGAQRAYNSQLTLTPDAPIRAAIAAAAAVAAGLARIKQIASQQFSASSSAASVSGAVGITAPTRTFQASELGQDFTGDRRVYVTEGDITKTQRRVQNLQRVSVVGG